MPTATLPGARTLTDPVLTSRRTLVLGGGLALAGCGTTVVNAPDPLKTAPTANESVVAVSLTGNFAQVGAADTIRVWRSNPAEPKKPFMHILSQVAVGMARDTALYVGTLPTGQYQFSSFDYERTRQYLSLNEAAQTRIGRFAVVSGKSVDLGRLIMTPVNGSVLVGRSVQAGSNLPLLQRFSPEHAKFFSGQAVTEGWQQARSAADTTEAYALLRPVGADNPLELTDGSIVMASRLGTAHLRSPSGRWSTVQGDGLEALLCVRPADLPDTAYVAVGEFSTLWSAAPGSSRFEPLNPGNLPPVILLFIGGI